MLTSLQVNPVQAASDEQPPSLFLDGHPLVFPVQTVIENGVSFVPMRPIFEAQGAKVVWDETAHTVHALKDNTFISYRIGDDYAVRNDEKLTVPVPGKIIGGSTMVPLRFISETLGNIVQWHDYSRSITISSAQTYETEVEYGVNLRTAPNSTEQSNVIRMLAKGERVHVIREIDANWLEVQSADRTIGFMSAKPKYSDYSSSALAMKQADEIIAFGSKYLGTDYEFGAATNQTQSFDCSSFVKHVFNSVLSLDLPRTSYDQAKEGKEVKLEDLRKGDLMFFTARGLPIGHVGIYAGDGKILHTYSDTLGVHFAEFEGQWRTRFVTARRLF
ncbi:stalk domain-containing protein [Paenibacillus montanisoli]|uniref:Copper amine oxidase n=1 Tax=Paenibacillus montanisoli TaxID=2081970 RepID=A0A328TZF7_9BACL|nr:stalk domain-containing protein [Paenibacillus montanisoli]RAP75927.1 copper amine oxidase [Paenibacillus montanisoli]